MTLGERTMATVIQMKRQTLNDILEVIEKLRYDLEFKKADLIHSEVVSDSHASLMMPGNNAAFLCFEQYFFRACGMVSASILIIQEDDVQRVTIVSPTARDGSLFLARADQALANRVEKVLMQMGFVETYKRDEDWDYEFNKQKRSDDEDRSGSVDTSEEDHVNNNTNE